ncbi:MAG: cobalamin B12-binding domain-containing protein [Desulfuromonadales bacterium]|nr:cobalamin B12-binding domain-containing protein [Desulfuromonadales bacterium]
MDMNQSGGKKIRVLMAKIGLDGHNRGVYVVSHGLRRAGFEVIYTGLRQTPAMVAKTAVEEDVDVIGISSMVGAHLSIVNKLKQELEKHGATDIPITIGGIIPRDDYPSLLALGVRKIFPTGTEVREIAQYLATLHDEPQWQCEVPNSLAGLNLGQLRMLGTHCAGCGKTFFPQRRNCPSCLNEAEVSTVRLSPTGTLVSSHVSGAAPEGFTAPHAQGYVQLDDGGPSIFTLLTEVAGSELKAGQAMELKCVENRRGDEVVVGYRFRPVV